MSRVAYITIEPESQRYVDALIALSSNDELLERVGRLFDRLSQRAAGYVIKNKLSGQSLHRRTGALAQSVIGRGVRVGRTPGFRVGVLRGPALRYAGVQEYGTKGENPDSPYATIVPKRAKALAFPPEGSPVLTKAGVARIQSPRDYEAQFGRKLVFVPFRRGIAIGGLYDERDLASLGKNGSLSDISAAYILLRRLDLKPKRFLYEGVTEFLPTVVKELGVLLGSMIAGKEAR